MSVETMIQLSATYPCLRGGPILTAVDRRIFSFRYFRYCLDCTFCHDACCQHGVDIDIENVARLKSAHPRLKTMVGVPEEDWFTGEVTKDAEFPSGRHVRTQTRGGFCVFHDPKGRGCLIHRYCLEEGIDYHDLKPMVSILFPVTFEQGALVPSSEILDGSLICGGDGPSCYDGARDELRYYFGENLVRELDALKSNLSPK
jgi:hypothetical protein